MIDTHCHLTDSRLFEQLENVLTRAKAAGVSRMVTIGTHPQDWTAALKVCESRPWLRCAIGVHPNYCHEMEIDCLAELRRLRSEKTVAALGEMGLDYHHKYATKARQAEFFQAQLQLATEYNHPVVIHCREATDDCLAILRGFPKVSAVVHCFTGTMAEAKKILDAGYLLGFTGVVTYKNAPELREIAAMAPSDRILVETDAPYLSPEPVRKVKTCEPAFVMHTAAAVASARNISRQDLDEITTANAIRFYQSRDEWIEGR
jgi:TatD DNase family protein